MPFYLKQGSIPTKRHTRFKKKDGTLHAEEVIGRHGFSSHSSILYHLRMPTRVKSIGAFTAGRPQAAADVQRPRHLRTRAVVSSGDLLASRRPLLFNDDVRISKCHPDARMDFFLRNGHFDELYFVQEGGGVLESQFGTIPFAKNDYVLIPRGTIWRMSFDDGKARFLLIESTGQISTPERYRSRHGQLLEHSPFCERDIRSPQLGAPRDESGDFLVRTVLADGIQDLIYDAHPFDVVGWDGYFFPWVLSADDFEPIVGSIHQPPPVHQTFETPGFVVCSFVSRPFDFHPDAIPAPYPHSNVDSDEVLFYAMGEFMSRKGIEAESLTLHPMGLAHGPHPGRYEESVGKKHTSELAVMIDTFKPLKISETALVVDDAQYPLSWL
ncbi:MAG: homogentisate 1,2-dioxygenase [Elusimicrobiota bacterium]